MKTVPKLFPYSPGYWVDAKSCLSISIFFSAPEKLPGGASMPGFGTNEIASSGQVDTHRPQPMHLPSIISAKSAPSLIAAIWHRSMHAPQAEQRPTSIAAWEYDLTKSAGRGIIFANLRGG